MSTMRRSPGMGDGGFHLRDAEGEHMSDLREVPGPSSIAMIEALLAEFAVALPPYPAKRSTPC